ncbi:MAG: ABC transporter ATP-binding protein [Gammaproteobacteria bacterium]
MLSKQLPNQPLTFLAFFAKKQNLFFILMACVAVIWAINETIYPFFIKLIVDRMSEFKPPIPHLWQTFALPLSLWLGCWIVTALALRFQGVLAGKGFAKLRANIRETVFYYLGHHSHEFFSDRFAGSLASKVADLASGAQTIWEMIIYNFISTVVFLISVFILLTLTRPIFSLILAAWVIIHFVITVLCLKKVNNFAEKHAESTSRLSGKITDAINNILTIRIFSSMNYELKYLNKYQFIEQKRAWDAAVSLEKMRLIQDGSTVIALVAMFGMLILSWQHNQITLGDVTLVGMLTFSALMYVWWCAFQFGQCVREIGKIKNALSELLEKHDVLDAPNAKPLIVNHPTILFDNVSFGYDDDRTLFDQLNLTIKAGEKIGLVGFSGAGKTTFIQLLLRFYDLKSGNIYIDGQNIADVTQDSLRQSIAMIPQESMLFHRSLMENIRYGNLHATDADVIEAAKQAECHEFITALPQTYQTLVGERGIKLSGGQRQRIAIARAMLKKAPILILDEATAALDSVTEENIQVSLRYLMRDVTAIVIAHRLSTLANMDRILVFSHGKIIEDGTMQSLLDKNGHFTQLWQKQKHGFIPG